MDNSNTSEEREFWLRWQTWPDVKHYIEAHTAHSYVHPYGFTVVRLQLPGSEPWLARVHFWDEKSPETSDLLIHRHGDWALMSKVLVGSIRETEYTFEPSEEGPYYEYAVSKSADNRQSSLVETGKRAYLRSARSQIRCATSPVMHIPPSSFHSTENSSSSISVTLALTEPSPGTDPARIMTASKPPSDRYENRPASNLAALLEQTDRHYSSETTPADEWASFVFVVEQEFKILMARTRRNPQKWMPIGGRKSATDETPKSTVLRELVEEMSLNVHANELEYLGSQPRDIGMGLTHFWLLKVATSSLARPNEGEIAEIGWFTIDECRALPLFAGTEAILSIIKRHF